ncbi:MAG: cytotoxic translational repressor of toxin-antitoxin stability system [Opitutae bacterium]|jgi:hypothetical protein|nr:cytotoxic translational repressor of toxin-antitoxin stability system [Opitutae bacterium]MBT5908348.1 cytotoxic translational repressor of toxin-antitoxin stability system [Opitutae bacterium]MBT7740748.1 cytotoxic translational repressor of toxin-antitoxin stability system [Opitutae bacterium]MBT7923362.1 cytotoxic translational repressor of toxin-antitoxin stability system [Opitutae bacterium]
MFQLTFSDQSMVEVNALGHVGQLELMERLSSLTTEVLSEKNSEVGRFSRNGKCFYRMRVEDLRVYFEHGDKTLHCHYILRKNTFNDFVIRFKLPVSEEQDLEKDQSFWEYLDGLTKKSPRE